jgi:hypothetical protein
MSQLCGMLKNPAITWKSDCLAKFDRSFLAHNSSHAVWRGAPLEMNGVIKRGVRVQTASKAEVRQAGVPPAPQIEEEEGFTITLRHTAVRTTPLDERLA